MGRGPDLQTLIPDGSKNDAALQNAIEAQEKVLNNTFQNGVDYINKYTAGILVDKDTKKMTGIKAQKLDSYTKFSESYSLDKLTPIIDGVVKFAVDYVSGGEDGLNAAKLAGDTGEIVKGILSLFASSSTTTKDINLIFTQFRKGDDNFAIYYASNSGSIAANNAWGNKELVVITNIYIFAQVNPDLAVTQAEARQHILDNLKKAEDLLSDFDIEAITNPNLDAVMTRAQKAIDGLKKEYGVTG